MIKPKILQWTAVAAAGVLLGGALVYYNFADKAIDSLLGKGCPNFTAKTFRVEGDTFSLDGDPFVFSEEKGKVIVINFWEDYCEPCKKEMAEFNAVQEKYAGQIEIIALAGSESTEKGITNWLNKKNWSSVDTEHDWADFSLTFGYLSMEESKKLGVTGTLPHTLIVDETGIVTFEQKGSITYEALENEVLKALKP